MPANSVIADPISSNPVPANPVTTLDHAGIAQRIPHAGSMCLLHSLLAWTSDSIRCSVQNHADSHNPLRTASGLLAPAAMEYASQAMALHSALCAGPGDTARAGYLASTRALNMQVLKLDTAEGPLTIQAQRLMGDQRQAIYHFSLQDVHAATLVEGRATVVLDGVPG